MRICSLMPGATEVVAALGLADALVGISHECDYPPSVRSAPVLLGSVIDSADLSSREIDQAVHAAASRGESLYALDEAALAKAAPDLVIMQDICDVCGITPAGIHASLARLPRRPNVLALRAMTLQDVLADVMRIGEAVGRVDRAKALIDHAQERLSALRAHVAGVTRPRVLCLEWLDPPYSTGHWVPEMIDAAGGVPLISEAGAVSRRIGWDEVVAAQPEMLVLAPCGFSIERTVTELAAVSGTAGWRELAAVRNGHVYVVDASPYFSRPGPRLVDGAELLAQLFHPAVFGATLPPGARRVAA
ncbi:MAG TPA: cobalamin-binding protein [Nitrospirales bacterium]|nr:cobalamin-binding protein [Nitrospirales bacterium]